MIGARAIDRPANLMGRLVNQRAVAVGLAMVVALVGAASALGCAAREVSSQRVGDELRARVEAALVVASDVDATGIRVSASGDVVTVTGHVGSGFEQQSVGAIVRAVPGVSEVRFMLTIDDPQAGR